MAPNRKPQGAAPGRRSAAAFPGRPPPVPPRCPPAGGRGVAAVVEPVPIAYLIDYLQGRATDLHGLGWLADSGARTQTLVLLCVGIVAIAAANSAADSLTEVCLARGGRVLGYRVRVAMYSHLQRLPLAYHDKRRTGDVLTRVTGDVLVMEDFVVKSRQQHRGQPDGARRQLRLPALPVLAGGAGRDRRRARCWRWCRTTSRAGSRSRPRPSGPGRVSSPRPPRRCSPRSGSCRATGGASSTCGGSPDRRAEHARRSESANIQAQFSFAIALLEASASAPSSGSGCGWSTTTRSPSARSCCSSCCCRTCSGRPARSSASGTRSARSSRASRGS